MIDMVLMNHQCDLPQFSAICATGPGMDIPLDTD